MILEFLKKSVDIVEVYSDRWPIFLILVHTITMFFVEKYLPLLSSSIFLSKKIGRVGKRKKMLIGNVEMSRDNRILKKYLSSGVIVFLIFFYYCYHSYSSCLYR